MPEETLLVPTRIFSKIVIGGKKTESKNTATLVLTSEFLNKFFSRVIHISKKIQVEVMYSFMESWAKALPRAPINRNMSLKFPKNFEMSSLQKLN